MKAEMTTHVLCVLAATFAVIATTVNLSAQAADSFAGVWRLNVAKSTYEAGPAPKISTNRLEKSADGWKGTQEQIDAQGKLLRLEATFEFDGREYPVVGLPNVTWTFTAITEYVYEQVAKRDGKVILKSRNVVSTDGKTRTETRVVTNAEGRTFTNSLVWEKQ
jgi:hypothetical protein